MRTFKEVFDLLTEAYVNGYVDPWRCDACFVGNLLGGAGWEIARDTAAFSRLAGLGLLHEPSLLVKSREMIAAFGYTPSEIAHIELVFLRAIWKEILRQDPLIQPEDMDYVNQEPDPYSGDYFLGENEHGDFPLASLKYHPAYEDALFKAFEEALDAVKEIHRSKGEDVDNALIFKKRKLDLVSA